MADEPRKIVKNYVISLLHATERRQHITAEFGRQGVAFEFFDAIMPSTLNQYAYSLNLSNLLENKQLSPTEKACFVSHIALMQHAIDIDLPYIAIFEDDIYLGDKATDYLTVDDYLSHHAIHLLKLETFLQYRKVDKQNAIPLFNNRIAYPLQEYHLGMAGYIISQSAISRFLAYVQALPSDKILPIDRLLFDEFMVLLNVHQLCPALCIQEHIKHPASINLPSSLEQERLYHRQHKPKRTFFQKLKSELTNVFKKTFGKLIRIKIGFR